MATNAYPLHPFDALTSANRGRGIPISEPQGFVFSEYQTYGPEVNYELYKKGYSTGEKVHLPANSGPVITYEPPTKLLKWGPEHYSCEPNNIEKPPYMYDPPVPWEILPDPTKPSPATSPPSAKDEKSIKHTAIHGASRGFKDVSKYGDKFLILSIGVIAILAYNQYGSTA